LLDASQFQSGRLTFNYEITDLRDVAREVLESCCEQLRVKSSKTTIELDQPALVLCDRFRMEQVMMNLLSNAMKYGAGREIQIRVEASGGTARLVVRDDGMGIPKEEQGRIFGRFERAVSANNISGLGLGLYIVQSIVEAHGGRIRVESLLNAGSTFTVELPLADAEVGTGNEASL